MKDAMMLLNGQQTVLQILRRKQKVQKGSSPNRTAPGGGEELNK